MQEVGVLLQVAHVGSHNLHTLVTGSLSVYAEGRQTARHLLRMRSNPVSQDWQTVGDVHVLHGYGHAWQILCESMY